MRFVRRVLILFFPMAFAIWVVSSVHADIVPANSSTASSEPANPAELNDDLDLDSLPRIPIPEPQMIFGIGVMSLALGGGLLVRHKKSA